MAKIVLNDNKIIGDFLEPYIVAEMNSSHNGNVETAKKMVKTAKEIGCSCAKFQSWSKESLYCKEYYLNNPIAKRIIAGFALNEDKLEEVCDYCFEQNISFTSTPYSTKEVDFLLEKKNVPFIKIASMDINNYELLRYIAKSGSAIVLATGMADVGEIDKAIECIETAGNSKICILHCVSIYPVEDSDINLNNIHGLRERFCSYPIGFSDHSVGISAACGAVALGAALIEKHFTLDNQKIGMDNNMATEPEEFERLVKACHAVFCAMGSKNRYLSENQMIQRTKMRRSVVSKCRICAGDVLGKDNLTVKRPGDGIPAEQLDELIGKIINCDVEQDMLIRREWIQ